MKKLITLFLVTMFLSITFAANAQQDTVMLKIKYEKFKSWRNTGRIMTLSGLVLGSVGTGLIIWGTGPGTVNKEWPLIAGSISAGVGAAMLIPGAVYWGIGKSKTREYKLRLENVGTGFYYKPGTIYAPPSAGIVLAYRF